MKFSILTKPAIGVFAVFFCANLWAVECDEVVWHEDVLSKYPNISEFCQEVDVRNGKNYVRFDAKFVRATGGKARMKFKHTDGSYGETFETNELPDSFRVSLDGEPTTIRNIPRDSELTVYMPSDRFTILGDVAEPYEVAMAYDDTLPETGSNLPLLAIFGFLTCLSGFALSVFRRFTPKSKSRNV